MNNIDFSLLKINLKKIVSKIFDNYKNEHNIKEICGMALFSDEDAMSLSMAINTYEHLANNINKNPGFSFDFKYNPEEWYEIIKNDELDKYNKALEKIVLRLKKKQFIKYSDNIYKIYAEILNELKEEEYFNGFNKDFVLLFSLSNFYFPEMIVENNKKNNSSEIVEEYEKWINEMKDMDR